MAKLIREDVDKSELSMITESAADGKKNFYIKGVFIQCEDRNRNGRIYRTETITKEVNRLNEDLIPNKSFYGENNHPATPAIDIDRVSILIEELKMDGKYGMGKAKVLSTPAGNILKGIIESGGRVGVSTRALGSLLEDNIVGDDLEIMAIDAVISPSAPDAFIAGIYESREFNLNPATGIYEASKIDLMEQEYDRFDKSIKRLSLKESKLVKDTISTFIQRMKLI